MGPGGCHELGTTSGRGSAVAPQCSRTLRSAPPCWPCSRYRRPGTPRGRSLCKQRVRRSTHATACACLWLPAPASSSIWRSWAGSRFDRPLGLVFWGFRGRRVGDGVLVKCLFATKGPSVQIRSPPPQIAWKRKNSPLPVLLGVVEPARSTQKYAKWGGRSSFSGPSEPGSGLRMAVAGREGHREPPGEAFVVAPDRDGPFVD
jgi:hypothetical protein